MKAPSDKLQSSLRSWLAVLTGINLVIPSSDKLQSPAFMVSSSYGNQPRDSAF